MFVRESKIDGVNDANFREKGNTDLLGFRQISTDSFRLDVDGCWVLG